jgi:hypothetical protein
VFSFFFVVFLSVEVIAHKNHVELVEVCGSYRETCKTVYNSLTDIQDELELIFIFLGATLLPQLLAYLLSGISGSTTAPQYISRGSGGRDLELYQVLTRSRWHLPFATGRKSLC